MRQLITWVEFQMSLSLQAIAIHFCASQLKLKIQTMTSRHDKIVSYEEFSACQMNRQNYQRNKATRRGDGEGVQQVSSGAGTSTI